MQHVAIAMKNKIIWEVIAVINSFSREGVGCEITQANLKNINPNVSTFRSYVHFY